MVHNNGYHTKENGKICRTIHLQHLNRQCKRDTSLPFSFPASMSSTTCVHWLSLTLIWHRHWSIILSSLGLSGTLLRESFNFSILPWRCQICWSTNHIPWYFPISKSSSPISGTFRCQTISLMPGKPSDMGLFYQLDHATISIIGQTKHQILLEWDTGSALPRLQENTHISSGR